MAPVSPPSVLSQLQSTQNQDEELSILRISEPIATTSTAPDRSPSKRTSDISADGYDNPTPASLEADLTHYKVGVVQPLGRVLKRASTPSVRVNGLTAS